MKDKLNLIPVRVGWKAGSYGISQHSAEADVLELKTVVKENDGAEKELKIRFPSFAEVRFYNFNFGEHHYNGFVIQGPSGEFMEDTFDWSGFAPSANPGFYEVNKSAWFQERDMYVSLAAKGYKHYILVGADSYVEVLATGDVEYI